MLGCSINTSVCLSGCVAGSVFSIGRLPLVAVVIACQNFCRPIIDSLHTYASARARALSTPCIMCSLLVVVLFLRYHFASTRSEQITSSITHGTIYGYRRRRRPQWALDTPSRICPYGKALPLRTQLASINGLFALVFAGLLSAAPYLEERSIVLCFKIRVVEQRVTINSNLIRSTISDKDAVIWYLHPITY